MNIGIIVHSQTGNTYSVAMKLKEKLLEAGHTVNIEKVIPLDEKQAEIENVQLQTIPGTSTYDALVFGAPVRGFSLSPAMTAYLSRHAAMDNKKVACLITQSLPFPWMGGNRSAGQMEEICRSKGANICGSGIVNWSSRQREKRITDLVERLSRCFN